MGLVFALRTLGAHKESASLRSVSKAPGTPRVEEDA
jgi:hypothetical protein